MYGVNSVQDILFRYPADCLMYLFSLIAIMFFCTRHRLGAGQYMDYYAFCSVVYF